MTVEELQTKILELEGKLKKEVTEKENLKSLKELAETDAKKLKEDNERLRDVNMQYFLQITTEPEVNKEDKQEEQESVEDDVKPLDELLKEL